MLLISSLVAQKMLNAFIPPEDTQLVVFLHTGNPGPTGLEHRATESTGQSCPMALVSEAAAVEGRKNSGAPEWREVKAAETYTFISLWTTLGKFLGYAELTAPKAVEVGNTFKFPIGSIVITV